MRVFDFDNTIYKGESAFDFYLFTIRYNPKVLKYLFVVLFHTIKYELGLSTKTELEQALKKYVRQYMSYFNNKDEIIKAFWDKHIKKIKPWYKPESDDIILTASFNIIMDELKNRFDIHNCICSTLNCDTMEVEYLNFGDNKLQIFREKYGKDAVIDEFYTDSIFDMPMMKEAKKAFLVKGDRIKSVNP